MATQTLEAVGPELGLRAAVASPVIVATDGREQSDAALMAGGILAGESDALRVVSVIKPMPIVSPEAQLPISPDFEASRRAQAKRAVLDQMNRVWQDGEGIALALHDGDPGCARGQCGHARFGPWTAQRDGSAVRRRNGTSAHPRVRGPGTRGDEQVHPGAAA